MFIREEAVCFMLIAFVSGKMCLIQKQLIRRMSRLIRSCVLIESRDSPRIFQMCRLYVKNI